MTKLRKINAQSLINAQSNARRKTKPKSLVLYTNATRRSRGDLIQKFKDISKIDGINWKVKPVVLHNRVGHKSFSKRTNRKL